MTRPIDGIELEYDESGVMTLRIDRPHRGNSFHDDIMLGLADLLRELGRDEKIKVLIITATGKVFSAGADLECSGFSMPTTTASELFSRRCHEIPLELRRFPVPTIAAVNGPAVGGGFGFALATDFRFMAPNAFFSAPFVEMGIAPDFGVSYFLPRLVGETKALELATTCRRVGAEESVALGLAQSVDPDPYIAASRFAEMLVDKPRSALSVAKNLIHAGADTDAATQLLVNESRAQGVSLHGPDFKERFAARTRK